MKVKQDDPEIKDYVDTFAHLTSVTDEDRFFREEWNKLQSLATLITHQMYALREVARRKGMAKLLPDPPEEIPEPVKKPAFKIKRVAENQAKEIEIAS